MGSPPEGIYSADEGALNSKLLQDYFKENKIDHIVTGGHAAYAGKSNGNSHKMIHKRLEKHKEARWLDVKILSNARVTYNWKMTNSVTKKTP